MPSFNLNSPTYMTPVLAAALQAYRGPILAIPSEDHRDAIYAFTAAAFTAATMPTLVHANCDAGECELCFAVADLASEIEYLMTFGYPFETVDPDGTVHPTR